MYRQAKEKAVAVADKNDNDFKPEPEPTNKKLNSNKQPRPTKKSKRTIAAEVPGSATPLPIVVTPALRPQSKATNLFRNSKTLSDQEAMLAAHTSVINPVPELQRRNSARGRRFTS